jgi:eukaryotic-like serine/threonine-protein kinase
LFELLSGQLPFTAESHTALALKHLQEEPPLITQYNPTVPRQIEQIIRKVMAKEASGRYRTAGQLGRILSTYRQSTQEDTGPLYPVTQRQQPVTAVPVSEQPTQIYERPFPDDSDQTPVQPQEPIRIPSKDKTSPVRTAVTGPQSAAAPDQAIQDRTGQPLRIPVPEQQTPDTDWIAVGLGMAALILLLGLIPLWYAVYQAWAG